MTFHEEDEQILEFKNFCIKYKKIIISVILVAAISFGSVFAFKKTTTNYNNHASNIYFQVMQATGKPELTDNFKNNITKLQQDYSKTEYASLASFIYAKKLIANGDIDTAKQQLNWVIDNSKHESIVIIAKQRLARVLMSESVEGADKALELLNTIKVPSSFDVSVFTLIGDAYYRKGDTENANLSYLRAKTLATNDGDNNILLQRKIDNTTLAVN